MDTQEHYNHDRFSIALNGRTPAKRLAVFAPLRDTDRTSKISKTRNPTERKMKGPVLDEPLHGTQRAGSLKRHQ